VTTPRKPDVFDHSHAPVGVEVKFVPFWQERPMLNGGKARLFLVHTNAASREGSIESAWNWATSKPNQNTIPHYQVDRSGRARKMLPTNRQGIANATAKSAQGEHGNVREWSLAMETADTGYLDDPSISAFTDVQAERVAEIIAYEHMVSGFPLEYPKEWYGAGVGCHTEPFGYPYWTLFNGKTCPGDKKKRQVRELIIPRAREIVAAWKGPPTLPAPEPTIAKLVCQATLTWEPVPGAVHYHVKWRDLETPDFPVLNHAIPAEPSITLDYSGQDLWVEVATYNGVTDGPFKPVYLKMHPTG
jgi:hypothetical protein